MYSQNELIEKLRKIEALFAQPGTHGEREAAAGALERIRERLGRLKKADPPIEYRFSMGDSWSRSLFVALLRRYDLKPYRYRGQRYTTVMVHVSASFVDETLWPEFKQLDDLLRGHLDQVTKQVIAEAFGGGDDEPELREQLPGSGATSREPA